VQSLLLKILQFPVMPGFLWDTVYI